MHTLSERGHDVAGTYLKAGAPELEIELYQADLSDRAALAEACDRFAPDRVLHLAGLSHVGASFERRQAYHRVNAVGTGNLVQAAGAAPVVLASSSLVYGQVPEEDQPIREERELSPETPYGESKVAAERLVLDGGGVVVRCFNVIGPGQAEDFAFPAFARQLAEIAAGERDPVMRVGNLEGWRDFIHLDDAAEGYAVLLERGVTGEIYNLATGRAHTVGQLLDRLIRLSGLEVRVERDPARYRPTDARRLVGDGARLRALGWEPRRDLDDALSTLLEDAARLVAKTA